MISYCDFLPWTKPGFIIMIRRQGNNQWSGGIADHAAPKKFRVQNSTGKVLTSIFWNQSSILLIDYLPNDQTINAQYSSSLLVQFKYILKETRRGKFTKGVLFLHKNTSAHRALAIRKKPAYLGFQCLDRPSFSPHLAPSDYHLFLPPGLKKNN